MKLIRCHIENFGKLSDFTVDFTSDLHIICENNGWGKSTLAEFIKIMLYGMTGDTKKDILENERKRFKPWQGGVYGGQLVFEAEGKEYILARTFGAKEKDDTFEIRDSVTNLVTTQFEKNIGEQLFQIDRESFIRTVFVSQSDCESASTATIDAKIGNLAEHTDDLNNFENACNKLTVIMNELSPKRKPGKCKLLEEKINELRTKVLNKESVEKRLQICSEELDELKKREKEAKEKTAALMEKQEKLSKLKDKKSLRDRYQVLCANESERLELKEQAQTAFPGRVPSEKEVREKITECSALGATSSALNQYPFSEIEANRIASLNIYFCKGVPEKQEIEQTQKKLELLNALSHELNSMRFTEDEESNWHYYEELFASGVPTDEEIEKNIRLCNERTEKKNGLSGKKSNLLTLKEIDRQRKADTEKAKWKRKLGFYVAAAIAAIIAIPSFIWNVIVGCVASAVALVLCVVGMLTRAMQSEETGEAENVVLLETDIASDELRIEQLTTAIEEFVSRFAMAADEYTTINQLFKLKNELANYNILRRKYERFQNNEKEKEYKVCEREVLDFFDKYVPAERQSESVNAEFLRGMSAACTELADLQARKAKHTYYEDLVKEQKASIIAFFEDLALDVEDNIEDGMNNILGKLLLLKNCEMEYNRSVREKQIFMETNDFRPEDTEELADEMSLEEISELMKKLSDEMEEIAATKHEREKQQEIDEEKLNELLLAEEELAQDCEELQTSRTKYNNVEKAQAFLKEAKANFTAEYTEPLRKALVKYATLFSQGKADSYHIDANAKLTVDEAGAQRETKVLSAGYRDYLGICMRLALVDAMYKEEKPFLVLDDPFVNLDDEKKKGAMEFLKTISDEYQIIYFTCHKELAL